MSKQMIGIFGGSFDPVHRGHLHLATQIYNRLHLKEIRFIPCAQNPLKPTPPTASIEDRLNMLRLAIKNQPYFYLDTREIDQAGHSYTIDTLHSLRQAFQDTPLAFIMASDTFAQFTGWKNWQHIINYTHLVIAKRPQFVMPTIPALSHFIAKHQTTNPQQLHEKPSGLLLFQTISEQIPISASAIRNQIHMHTDNTELLPAAVDEYIKKHQLY